ncbi:hypothetical protein [Bifidobacterium crudilactis]|uniref:hypothetical protein n=1 Tax=Bifidobacterium crudilactis TaxID=327277 RepID=UPI00054DA184|nr:hypothetical protein [Bifidobacterium crudilactis]
MSDQPRDPRTQQWQEKPRHGGTDDLEDFERVETLVVPREPVSRMPKWSDTEQPWSTCHRLGKYLLSGEDEGSIRERALAELRETWGDDVMPISDDESEDEIGFMRRDNPTALFVRDGLGYFMVDMDGTSKHKYRAEGNRVSRRTRRKFAYVRGMRLTTLVGAKAIYPKGERGGDDFAAVVHESKYAWRIEAHRRKGARLRAEARHMWRRSKAPKAGRFIVLCGVQYADIPGIAMFAAEKLNPSSTRKPTAACGPATTPDNRAFTGYLMVSGNASKGTHRQHVFIIPSITCPLPTD